MHGDATDRNDVEEVVVTERVDDGADGPSSDGHALTSHASTAVHQHNDILRRRSRLDVPAQMTRGQWVKASRPIRSIVFINTCIYYIGPIQFIS